MSAKSAMPPRAPLPIRPAQPVLLVVLDSIGGNFLRLIALLWESVEGKIAQVGEVIILLLRIIRRAPWFFVNPSLTLEQFIRIGVSSLPLVMVISFLIGAV